MMLADLRILACVLLCSLPLAASAVDLIGSMSCASATCHGGVEGRGPAWNHSFNVSRSRDPHVKAGLVLYEPSSQRIVRKLASDVSSKAAYDKVLRERCISCHLTTSPSEIVSQKPLDPLQIFEGVSCESCHGAASSWKDAHTKASWTGSSRFEVATGMLDTESILGRAEVCMRCHVGSRTADGMVRDMNHDLIAAGHPALRFDLLIYQEYMPHHWDDNGAVETAFNESPYRVRAITRYAGLAAAARLSGERAQHSLDEQKSKQEDAPNSVAVSSVPWPELADFDCFACHQSLSPRAFRLPASIDGEYSLKKSDGLPLWNAWYAAPVATAESLSTTEVKDGSIWELRPKPGNQAEWIEAANTLAAAFRERAIMEASSVSPASPFTAIRTQLNRRAPSDWHAAVATYLELDTAVRELLKSEDSRELGKKAERVLIEEVKPLLLFGMGETLDEVRASSPGDFDPTKFRDATLKALNSVNEE
jgi:hypothetical protein